MLSDGINGLSFAGCILETFGYGLVIPLFIKSVIVLYYESNGLSPKMRNVMSLSTIVLFLCITTHWILVFVRLFEAFIMSKNTAQYLTGGSDPKQEASTIIFSFASMTLNGFLTYRTYLVWENDFIVCIAPFLGIAGTLAGGVGNAYGRATATNAGDLTYLSTMSPYILVGIISTFFTTLWCSSLISFRIWNGFSAMKMANVGHWGNNRKLTYRHRFLHTFIESGMLMVLVTLVGLIAYPLQPATADLIMNLTSPIIGVTFTMIIIRVGHAASAAHEEPKRPPPLSMVSPREAAISINPGLSPGLRTSISSTSSFGDHEIQSGKVESA